MENKSQKSLYIRVSKEMHSEIKRLAAYRYMTMEHWITMVLQEKLITEKGYFVNNEIPK